MNHDTHEPLRILQIESSARGAESSGRKLGNELVEALRHRHGDVTVEVRDVAKGLPFVDQAWVGANFTDADQRSDAQREILAVSDRLVEELKAADILVITVPIYNFAIPASLKAWIDLIARARLTFRYTSEGPKGLLTGKKAYLVVTSGGVPVDSPVDFATPYLRHVLGFVGNSDVEVIAADRQSLDAQASFDRARSALSAIAPLALDAA